MQSNGNEARVLLVEPFPTPQHHQWIPDSSEDKAFWRGVSFALAVEQESHEIAPGIWQHISTPREPRRFDLAAMDDLIDTVAAQSEQNSGELYFTIHPEMWRRLRKLRHLEYRWAARHRRMVRRRKIERRQKRAAFRRRK